MTSEERQQVLEILDYWKTIEFLSQIDIPEESPDNKKLRRKIEEGEKTASNKIELFMPLVTPYLDMEKLLEKDAEKYAEFPAVGEEFHFSIGAIERNMVVEYLEKYVPKKEEKPEIAYPKKSKLAWCSFKTDAEGNYVNNSFQLSPVLWAIKVWEKTRVEKSHSFSLTTDDYDELVSKFNEELQEQNVKQFLAAIYEQVYKEYIRDMFPNCGLETMGFLEYNRYANEEKKGEDEEPTNYADLGKSFYLKDLSQLLQMVKKEGFGEHSAYKKQMIGYILSGYHKTNENAALPRTIISPDEPQASMQKFFEDILHVKNAPRGKWPAKFMPALMQQVAVNIAIRQDASAPIFSVNGPPGTGKTTLLKEIVASNIVERAKLIADNGNDPDAAFEKCNFTQGPLESFGNSYYQYAPAYYKIKNDTINNYSMLVTSCNNAAVENITIDLPKGSDILESLEASKDDDEEIKKGLDEVHDLFDIEKSDDIEQITKFKKTREEKDIFFTRYANSLLGVNDCWGLVSAPFGKRANIRKYCTAVLKPFIEEYKSSSTRDLHKIKFKMIREKFLAQYKIVEGLEKELEKVCDLAASYPSALDDLMQKYFVGAKKLTPIDKAFIEKYTSIDEKLSTKAQITNPWFTAQYNREREKLFLYACKLHKEFVASSKCMRQNIINLMIAWNLFDDCGERMTQADKEAAMPVLLQSIFLMTPVISTTFASAQTFLGDVNKSGVLGALIVDESGQAQPQMAVGAMFRCRKAIIVGDPKQIEPVVTEETDMIKQLMTSKVLSNYKDKRISVQGFADYINPYGTFLGEEEEKEWVGCPLVVHRRCIDPMYSISNLLSYDGTMKQQTGMPKEKRVKTFILEKSCWINVTGNENSGNKDHFVRAQGEIVLKLLEEKFKKDTSDIPKLFIITPFTSVKNGMLDMIRKSAFYRTEPRVQKWLADNNVGTVHTFQGQGTDEVIFLLGCDRNSVSAANWVNKNIVNVAATRAKFRFYMIGDKSVWTCKPVGIAREITGKVIAAEELVRMLEGSDGADGAGTPEQVPAAAAQKTEPKPAANDMICPQCGKPLVERNGKFGKFIACTGFPKCRYSRSIK